jgi:HSP20 family molecular chaperone IbpA
MQPIPTRAPACRHSVANLRTSTPAKQLNRPQSTANMRAPARRAPAAQNSQNLQIKRQPSTVAARQSKPQAPAQKEPQFKAYETDAAYHILASLPEGVDRKSIDIRFKDDNMLIISGNVEKEMQETETEDDEVSESESESEEVESESEIEAESEVESESESSTEVESETKADTRSLQPYVEDTDDIDDPRTPRAKASLQMRRGSSSSSQSSGPEASLTSSTSANSASPSAKLNAQAKTFTPQPPKTEKTTKSPIPKPNTKQVTKEVKKQMVTEKFNKKFQFPRPVEMRGVKARLEEDKLEVMVPKKRVMRGPRMWYV